MTKSKVFLGTVITFSLTLFLLSRNLGLRPSRITGILRTLLIIVLKDNKYRVREKVITVHKKTLFLVLPCLGPLLQTRTKLKKSLKGILSCCKLQILFKVKTNQQKLFVLKIVFPRDLHLVSSINFSVGSAINPIVVNA